MNYRLPGPGDESTWGMCTGHSHDPRTETEEDFWDVCIDDDVFDNDVDLHEDEEGDAMMAEREKHALVPQSDYDPGFDAFDGVGG